MKIKTERQLIQAVASRWRKAYSPFTSDVPFNHRQMTKRQVADELDKLDLNIATTKDVGDIIGNTSWTALKCDECGEYVDALIQVGEEPDYESSTASLCKSCIRKAAELFQ